MMQALFMGLLFSIGVMLMLRGANPAPRTLAEEIRATTDFDTDDDLNVSEGLDHLRRQVSVRLFELIKSESIDDVRSDVMVAGKTIESLAADKLNAGFAGAIMVGGLAWWKGAVSGVTGLLIVALLGSIVGYIIPDIDLKRTAAARRVEFEKALNAFVGLVSVSMTGGGGLNTAMGDAVQVGRGWVFETLTSTLDDSVLRGENAWTAFDRLGRRLKVDGLIELAGALALAGNSGARVTETLLARADAGRKKEMTEARSQAEKTSASLGVPVGAMLLGWVGFLAYPAIANLLAAS